MPLVFGGFVAFFGIPTLLWGVNGLASAYFVGLLAFLFAWASKFIVETYWRDK